MLYPGAQAASAAYGKNKLQRGQELSAARAFESVVVMGSHSSSRLVGAIAKPKLDSSVKCTGYNYVCIPRSASYLYLHYYHVVCSA